MRREAIGLVLALVGGCSSARSESSVEPQVIAETAPVAAEPVSDAGPAPERAQALEIVERFAARILAKDVEGAKAEMRIPGALNDKQVAFFLRELCNGEHLSPEGLAAVLQKDFGRIEERLGDKAGKVAAGAHLTMDEAFVLGDLESAVVMHWDGKRFWISALHGLGPEG